MKRVGPKRVMSAMLGSGQQFVMPANLPAVETATLPRSYHQACAALRNCGRVDECKDWEDRAKAVASYARQAQDDILLDMCLRIQARASRRCGELLREIAAAPGARTDLLPQDGHEPRLTRTAVADEAGLSERQRKTALRVAAIPEPQFEAAVESNKPPTVAQLAHYRDKNQAVRLIRGLEQSQFSMFANALGALERCADHLDAADMQIIAATCDGGEREECLGYIARVEIRIAELKSAFALIDPAATDADRYV